MRHLAIFKKDFIERILQGEKVIESRFSTDRRPPFKMIKKGNEILLKESGGPVFGKFIADEVHFFERITPKKVSELKEKFG